MHRVSGSDRGCRSDRYSLLIFYGCSLYNKEFPCTIIYFLERDKSKLQWKTRVRIQCCTHTCWNDQLDAKDMQVLTKVQVIFEHSRSDYNSFCYLCSVCRKLHSWYLANRHLCSSVSTVLQVRMSHHAFLIPRDRLQQLDIVKTLLTRYKCISAQMPFL